MNTHPRLTDARPMDTHLADTGPRSRYLQRNQGAERVGQVLELLSLSAQPLSLQEVSQRLGMHPSTAHRLLKTLEDQGLIARPGGTERYRLGPTILRLATRMLSQYPVRDIAAPYLYRLALDLGLTVSLSTYEDGYITYLDSRESPEPFHIVLRAGGTAPAHCVSAGLVQLAYVGDAELERLVKRGLPRCRSGKTMDLPTLRQQLAQVRADGYASVGDWLPGADGMAVPVLDANSRPIAALSVITFAGQFPPERLQATAVALKQAAAAIAAELGSTTEPRAQDAEQRA